MENVTKTRPAFRQAKAIETLNEIIERLFHDGETILPSLTNLANQCKVSRTTTLNALSQLCKNGTLHRIPYRGYQIIEVPPVKPSHSLWKETQSVSLQTSSERIKQALSKDIANRISPPGSHLPSQKALRNRFKVSHQTLLGALKEMEEQNLIVFQGRNIVVTVNAPRRNNASIVFIIHHYMNFDLVGGVVYGRDLWRTLEDECMQRGISLAIRTDTLEPLLYKRQNSQFLETRNHLVVKMENSIGYIIWSIAFEPDHLIALVQGLLKTGRPVTVLDDKFDITWPQALLDKKHLRVVYMGDPENLGIQLGLHLAELEHYNIAFFCYEGYELHVQGRIEGIKKAYSRRIQEVSVKKILIPQINDEELQSDLFRILDKELQAGNTSAWIGFNDEIALQLIDFLHFRNRRVPTDISVAGFDNSLDSFIYGLTTVSFNVEAAIPLILNHQSGIPDPILREKIIVIESKRICRTSTGPAPVKKV